MRTLLLTMALSTLGTSVRAETPRWTPATIGGPYAVQGPGPSQNGQLEGIPGRPISGAVNALATHPSNPDVLWLGAVNGGLWRTTNATASNPTWTPLSDGLASLSIGRDALQLDPTDAGANTLLAGIGRSSSYSSNGGARSGLLRSTDAGATWTQLTGGGTLTGRNVVGVAARGATLLAAVNNFNGSATVSEIGIYRSTDTGASFTRVSGSAGLPAGRVFDLAADPSNLAQFYTTVRDAGASNGIYKSTDTGASWTRVSDAAINALVSDVGSVTSNVKLSVGTSDNVYAAIANAGRLAGLFRSGDGGGAWSPLDLPSPTIHPGGQGGTHLSLVASRSNPNVVFVGGDRQQSPFPNDVGAFDFSGRLFRVDASAAPGNQARHLTHSSGLGPAGGGTANNSAPHADSRIMVFDASGTLLEGDDGGVYRRTSAHDNSGVWTSLIGNLVVGEFHGIAYDGNTDTVFGGTQDNGTPQQVTPGNQTWSSISTADGGDVTVDDVSTPGQSLRFSSNQNLGAFRRRTYNAAGTLLSTQTPTLTVSSGAALAAQFYTPLRVNAIDGQRLIVGAANGAYESFNRGDTLVQLGTSSVNRNALAYGGRRLGVDNPDVLYVGAGAQVFVRTVSGGTLSPAATYPGGTVVGLAMNPTDWREVIVADASAVFRSTDAGATWSTLTHDLASFDPGPLRSVSFVAAGPNAAIVGADRGVLGLKLDATTWERVGTGLPNAPVFELDYDAGRDKLSAGLLGRGVWLLTPVAPDVAVELQSFELD